MDFIVERDKWVYGVRDEDAAEKLGQTALRNEKGRMCCLGFVCEQLGVDKELLVGKLMPTALVSCGWPLAKVSILVDSHLRNTDLAVNASNINDETMEFEVNAEREEALQRLFEEYGHTISFIGEYDE